MLNVDPNTLQDAVHWLRQHVARSDVQIAKLVTANAALLTYRSEKLQSTFDCLLGRPAHWQPRCSAHAHKHPPMVPAACCFCVRSSACTSMFRLHLLVCSLASTSQTPGHQSLLAEDRDEFSINGCLSSRRSKPPNLLTASCVAELGCTRSQAAAAARAQVRLLACTRETLQAKRLEVQVALGLSPDQARKLAACSLNMLLCNINSPQWQIKLRWWREHDGRPYTSLQEAHLLLG